MSKFTVLCITILVICLSPLYAVDLTEYAPFLTDSAIQQKDSTSSVTNPQKQQAPAIALPHLPKISSLNTRQYTSLRPRPTIGLWGSKFFQFRLNGAIEISPSIRVNQSDNPTLSEGNRRRTSFLLDPRIEVQAEARLGRKLSLNLSYNTQTVRPDMRRNIRVSYLGDSTELIRKVDLGQFAYTPQNSLLGGSHQMTGIKAQLSYKNWGLTLFADRADYSTIAPTTNQSPQRTRREIPSSLYDARRHFFLAHYFRSHYDEAMLRRPQTETGIQILRLEVWITRKQQSDPTDRNSIAFVDLAEGINIHSSEVIPTNGKDSIPYNEANSLPNILRSLNADEFNAQSWALASSALKQGSDYELMPLAHLLQPSEYTVNKSLGYISLIRPLEEGEALAVAYEYSYQGKVYRVGTLSNNTTNSEQSALTLKLIYGRADRPSAPYWQNMMRNVYLLKNNTLGSPIESLQISLALIPQGASKPTEYFPTGQLQGQRLTDVLSVDLLNDYAVAQPDGRFDLIEGLTLDRQHGWLYFPTLEPFGQTLQKAGAEESLIYRELYLQTPQKAQQFNDKDKYRLLVSYSSAEELAPSESSTPTPALSQTLLGLELSFRPKTNLAFGFSLLQLREQTESNRILIGQEPMKNTLWGANFAWQTELKPLSRFLRTIAPHLSVPSKLSFGAEWAYLHKTYAQDDGYHGLSAIDDFEDSYQPTDLIAPEDWHLASAPNALNGQSSLQTESMMNQRAHLSWFTIDPSLQRESVSHASEYSGKSTSLLSNHYSREISVSELYPTRELTSHESSYLSTLNLRFYPNERGPYNLNTSEITPQGTLLNPQQHWAGIQRALPKTNFEAENIDYLEFWLLDPFLEKNTSGTNAQMTLHLGDISEDVLPDGLKSSEQNLPVLSQSSATVQTTPWANVGVAPTMGFAFTSSGSDRSQQDLGLDGLSSDDERSKGRYKDYHDALPSRLSSETLARWQNDDLSPLNDPSGDNYRHFRDNHYDKEQTALLDRYKYINGTEGNSSRPPLFSTNQPDSEDINQDNSLQTRERYFEYAIPLNPNALKSNAQIVATRRSQVTMPDGSLSEALWYLFRIPLKSYNRAIGGIQDFRTIRFMRLMLSGFKETTNLRFASMRLMKGSWRIYEEPIDERESNHSTKLITSVVSLEAHSDRSPINYILPPEGTRLQTRADIERKQDNEQSLSLRLEGMTKGSTAAIYRQGSYDLRGYQSLQMSVHAELPQGESSLTDSGDLQLFIRLGSDLTQNYYEYSLPLSFTPHAHYSNGSYTDRMKVWPESNRINLNLRELISLKERRNKKNGDQSLSLLSEAYSEENPYNPLHRISILGSPTLSRISSIMIGVRNLSGEIHTAEIWLNDLVLGGKQEERAWATQAYSSLTLSSVGSIRADVSHKAHGFGLISTHQSVGQEQTADKFDLLAQLDLGQLFPPKLKGEIPLSIRYENQTATPRYNPLEDDTELNPNSANYRSSLSQRDLTSIDLIGLKFGIQSKKPMPYDPANFRIDYSYLSEKESSPTLQKRQRLSWQLNINYDYSLPFKALRPFSSSSGLSSLGRYLKDYKLELWPRKITLQSLLSRAIEEEQLRDLFPTSSTSIELSPTLYEQYLWKRKLNLNWSLTPDINLTLTTGTDARLESPQEQILKTTSPDKDQLFREEVQRSLLTLGTPWRYSQTSSITVVLPTSHFPKLSWISTLFNYNSTYEWQRGNSSYSVATHTISSQGNSSLSMQLDLQRLYKLLKIEKAHSLLRSLQDVHWSWQSSRMLTLPGYQAEIGKAFGQRSIGGSLHPGLAFSLGLRDGSFVEELLHQNLLTTDPQRALSGIFSESQIFDLRIGLRPLKGLNITLLMTHNQNRRKEYLYSAKPVTVLFGGDQMMTTVGLRDWFSTAGEPSGSALARRLQTSGETILGELQAQLNSRGISAEYKLSPQDPSIMIPAFRRSFISSAHTLELIPNKIFAMLPNWNITYTLPEQWRFVKRHFSSLTLRHAYRGIYRTHNYDDRLGIAPLEGTTLALESYGNTKRIVAQQDVSSVSLTETFFPLLGVDLNFRSGLSLISSWRTTRNISLAVASARLIESLTNEWSIGISYHLKDLQKLLHPALKTSNSGRGLTMKADYSRGRTNSSITMMGQNYTQMTLGNNSHRLNVSVDYELSKIITLRGFYEWQYDEPLNTSLSYPSIVRAYGISLRLAIKP